MSKDVNRFCSIDDDILKLIDEVELDTFLQEASEAIDDADKLAEFIREKAAAAIERFLVSLYCLSVSHKHQATNTGSSLLWFSKAYLPKLSIPVERRELGDGWVLTVGQDGGGVS